jgi:hypothetical protein
MMTNLCLDFYMAVKPHMRCCICHRKDGVQLHHVRPADKISEVIKVAKCGIFTDLIDEFNKCVGVCDEHHREIHRGVRQGWLDGKYDNGKASHAMIARQFMPYLDWISLKESGIQVLQIRRTPQLSYSFPVSQAQDHPRIAQA